MSRFPDAAAGRNTAAAATATLPSPFSPLDEERDIEAFQDYLRHLGADALHDIQAHLDTERFPRRGEALERELSRRRLFFVCPYTGAELKIRTILSVCLCLALLAAVLRVIGSVTINLHPSERLPFFTDLAVGSPRAARIVLPAAQSAALIGSVLSALLTVRALYLLARRRIRRDIALLALFLTAATLLLTRCAFS